MANYTSNLKTWGSTGEEFPDNYNYVEGEQPVDAWDNFVTHNVFTDIDHLVSLTNTRLESVQGTSHPSSPESGEFSYRTDSPSAGSGDQLFQYDDSSASWHRLMKASGDTMTGVLDMNNNSITDSGGDLNIESSVSMDLPTTIGGASFAHDWHEKQEGGTVTSGSVVPIGSFELADGDTISVTQAMLTEDGFTTPADSGVNLVLASDDGTVESNILSGDGSTLYLDEEGSPLESWTNATGGVRQVIIGLDNGNYGTGTGTDVNAYGGYVARVH